MPSNARVYDRDGGTFQLTRTLWPDRANLRTGGRGQGSRAKAGKEPVRVFADKPPIVMKHPIICTAEDKRSVSSCRALLNALEVSHNRLDPRLDCICQSISRFSEDIAPDRHFPRPV